MNRIVSVWILVIFVATAAFTQHSPTLTIVNQAGDPATVRIIGPTAGYLEVASGASRAASISGGTYRLKIRYCNDRGNCHYSETDSFTLTQTTYSVSHVTVTLYAVGGNLNEHGISESEFNN